MQTIQMDLSQQQDIFSEFFSAFFEFPLNFQHFQKKITLIFCVFPKLPTAKDVLREMSKRSCSRGPVDRRQGRRVETLIQS